jgi:toxin ParE1/3/4
MKIELSPAAVQDLRDIWRGFAENSTLNLADKKIAILQNKLTLLSQFPAAGRQREELMLGMRSLPALEFVIFYQIFDTKVQIVRILNGRRDIDQIFQKRDP